MLSYLMTEKEIQANGGVLDISELIHEIYGLLLICVPSRVKSQSAFCNMNLFILLIFINANKIFSL